MRNYTGNIRAIIATERGIHTYNAEIISMLTVELLDYAEKPVNILDAIINGPYAAFLHSSSRGVLGRWSFIGIQPFRVLTGNENLYDELAGLLEEYRQPYNQHAPPFTCGAIGYLAYDLARRFEKIPSLAADDLPMPDHCLAFYDCTIAFDNLDGRAWISYIPSGREKARELKNRISSIRKKAAQPTARPFQPGEKQDWSGIKSVFTKDEYLKAVERVKEYIAAGDVYQVNLSQRFETKYGGDPWAVYKALSIVNPSPFACYLDFPGLTLASASPERLVHLNGSTKVVETRPIKGTRPRGQNETEDNQLAAELAASEKDHAENLMIVDLERNDLGKICKYGSIHVPSLWSIEKHPNVFQMVSTVKGALAEDKGPADLLAAMFPGGSITGAPKLRSMQIIEELEPVRRGIYTGSVGYIDFNGNMDFNIIIRSLVLRGERAYFHAGGGIVADSEPEKEYQETLDKVNGLVAALSQAI